MKSFIKALASLRLAVVVMAMSMVLIFVGTTAQVDTGIWQVQKEYFHSFWTWIEFKKVLLKNVPGGFPFPGGYLLGGVLLANLLAAHITRFKYTSKRIGVILIHSGLILLLFGEAMTSLFARETQMTLEEGVPTRWAQDIREPELAVIDPTSPGQDDQVVVVRAGRLAQKGDVKDQRLPFDIQIDDFYRNSTILGPMQPAPTRQKPATAGMGLQRKAIEAKAASGVEGESVDIPSAYVTLSKQGKNLGTYLLSAYVDDAQEVVVDVKPYKIQLRFRRFYKPYTIELEKFSHDKYTGTETAKNFSSLIRLTDPDRHESREIKIWMNHPLSYSGETFYQQSFRGNNISVLQIVKNPARWGTYFGVPYLACLVGALGMLIHFGTHLVQFIGKQNKMNQSLADPRAGARPPPLPGNGKRNNGPPAIIDLPPRSTWSLGTVVLPAIMASLALMFIGMLFQPPSQSSKSYDFNGFGVLPIMYEGRIQPLDSVARNSLRAISGRESISMPDGKTISAIQWLLETIAVPETADGYKVVRIDHTDVKSALQLDPAEKFFSLVDLKAKGQVFDQQFQQASQTDAHSRNDYQRKIMELAERLKLYVGLTQPGGLLLAPPIDGQKDWQPLGAAMRAAADDPANMSPAVKAFMMSVEDYRKHDVDAFNKDVKDYRDVLQVKLPAVESTTTFEDVFNHASPFFWSMFLYVGVFVFAACSWLGARITLARTAFWLLLITFAFHTFGLAGRVWITSHGPVTNLYSSAVFIAWAGALMCIFLELIFRNGIPTAFAAVIAVPTLIIGHCLTGDGDTMKPLQAVLDTNLWLWTHVICVTLGYTATYMAGLIAIAYVCLGVFTNTLEDPLARKTFNRMIYGVICFGMLFSFVGTILGGIWADQSWGRFWGWDPKENGAVLIVLWNALVLHARWCGWARERGVAVLAIFGNIVTSWSWFGTNMLGVGLHSYGFMDSAFYVLVWFIASQLLLIGIGSLPLTMWRSHNRPVTARGQGFPVKIA